MKKRIIFAVIAIGLGTVVYAFNTRLQESNTPEVCNCSETKVCVCERTCACASCE